MVQFLCIIFTGLVLGGRLAEAQILPFDFFGILDPFGLNGINGINGFNGNNFLFNEVRAPCVSNSAGTIEGTCVHVPDCRLSQGTNSGRSNCSAVNVCCTYDKTCNQVTRARVVYFRSPPNARQNSTCNLRLLLLNEDICQIRVDIISMNLADPSATFTCSDSFVVSPTPTVAIPPMCGQISNSHFYIHLNRGLVRPGQPIDIGFILQQAGVGINDANWNLKLTQLECPGTENKLEKNKKRNPNQAARDFGELAPPGCLQYYTQPSGIIQNFGFKDTGATNTNDQVNGQNYAACIKPTAGSCIRYTYNYLMLAMTEPCTLNWIYPPSQTLTPVTTPNDGRRCVIATPVPGMEQTGITSLSSGPQYILVMINDISQMGLLASTNPGFSIGYTTVPC